MSGSIMKDCAYKMVCKGVCNTDSCLKNKKSEEEYWKEIQVAMVAVGRLERIRHYLSTNPKIIRNDIIQKWATLSNIQYKENNSTCSTCDGKKWVYDGYSELEEPPKIDCPYCSRPSQDIKDKIMRKFDLIVKSCRSAECPAHIRKESHGPCDSDCWSECSISNNRVIKFAGLSDDFPEFCPLKECTVPDTIKT